MFSTVRVVNSGLQISTCFREIHSPEVMMALAGIGPPSVLFYLISFISPYPQTSYVRGSGGILYNPLLISATSSTTRKAYSILY